MKIISQSNTIFSQIISFYVTIFTWNFDSFNTFS